MERSELCICFATTDNCVLVAVEDSLHMQRRGDDTLFIMNSEQEWFKGSDTSFTEGWYSASSHHHLLQCCLVLDHPLSRLLDLHEIREETYHCQFSSHFQTRNPFKASRILHWKLHLYQFTPNSY